MKTSLCLLLCVLPALRVLAQRDPFWPIGFTPGGAVSAVASPVAAVGIELTEEQLKKLAEEEAERIRQALTLKRTGTAIFGNTIRAYIQNRWVGVGDSIPVEVQGRSYRLEILQLTSDNIELKPHPITDEPQP